jgi:flagellar motility protein MotE (MotC chaperone)
LDIRNALERMADADEKRNELLEADRAERRLSWAESETRQDDRLRAIVEGLPSDPPA